MAGIVLEGELDTTRIAEQLRDFAARVRSRPIKLKLDLDKEGARAMTGIVRSQLRALLDVGRAQRKLGADMARDVEKQMSAQRKLGAAMARDVEKQMSIERRLERDRVSWAAADARRLRERTALLQRQRTISDGSRGSALLRLNKEMLADLRGGGSGGGGGGNPTTLRGAITSLGGGGQTALLGFAGAAITIGALRTAIGMAEGFLGHARSFIGEVVQQTEYKRGVIGKLTGLLGSTGAANSYYEGLQSLADRGSFSQQDITPSATRLLNLRGMTGGGSMTMLTAMSDLIANTTVKPGAFKTMTDFMSRGMQGQVLRARAWNTAQHAGAENMTMDNAIHALMRVRGIKESVATKLFSGKASQTDRAQAFVDAVLELAKQRDMQFGGGAGAATNFFGDKDLKSQVKNLTDKFGRFFQDIDTSPLTTFLRDLNNEISVGSPLFKEFKDSMGSIFTDLIDPWVSQYKGAEGQKKLHDDLHSITEDLKKLGEVAGFASSAIRFALDQLLGTSARSPLGGVGQTLLYGTGLAAGGAVGAGLGSGFGPLGTIGGGALGAAGGLLAAFMANKLLGAVPHAAGGITTGPHLGMVGEAGPEAIIPLSRAPEILARANEMSGDRWSGGGRGGVTVNSKVINNIESDSDHDEMAHKIGRATMASNVDFWERASAALTGGV